MVVNVTHGHNGYKTEISATSNYMFAATYILCMLVGLPGNLISLQYFISKGGGAGGTAHNGNKAFFNRIYVLISAVDAIVCLTLVPVIASFLYLREEYWFANHLFCMIWGMLWEMVPYFSVYLVGLMSISRTVVLIKPLCPLKMKVFWGLTIAYATFLILRTLGPIWIDAADYKYIWSDVYCYELPKKDWSYKFNSISRSLTLAAPIIPICISCATSYTIIILNERKQNKMRHPSVVACMPLCKGPQLPAKKKLKINHHKKSTPMNATRTILIFTIAYIVFNIPIFINYLLMSIAGWSKDCVDDCYHKKYGAYPILIWYSWNFTYIMCVALNSMINPIIYYWRMRSVKEFIDDRVRVTSRQLLDLNNRESVLRKRVSNVFRPSGYTQTYSVAEPVLPVPELPTENTDVKMSVLVS